MARSPKLDKFDFAILRALQENGRMTKVALADAVNLSASPCWERLKKLEQSGLITGYRAMVDIRKVMPVTEVLIEVTLSGHKAEDFRRFEALVQARREVQACWALGGGIDYIIRLIVSDVDAYQRFMDDLLDGAAGIERYFGYVVTKSVKDSVEPIPEI